MTTTASPTVKKIAISIPEHIYEQARLAVDEGRASSVSAYFAAMAEHDQREGALRELVNDLIAEQGAPSADDYAWADAALDAHTTAKVA